MTKLVDIEEIGGVYAEKLISVGIKSVEQLRDYCGQRKARIALAGHTQISEKLILSWVNRADLCRIKGINSQYADLLVRAGVDSVPKLAQSNPEELYQQLLESENIDTIDRFPSVTSIADWIEQAKMLPIVVFHWYWKMS